MSNVTDIINDTVDPARGVAAEPVSTKLAIEPPKLVPKAKAPSRWRGQTWVYLNKAGERYAIYHRNSAGTQSWEHGYSSESRVGCVACSS